MPNYTVNAGAVRASSYTADFVLPANSARLSLALQPQGTDIMVALEGTGAFLIKDGDIYEPLRSSTLAVSVSLVGAGTVIVHQS